MSRDRIGRAASRIVETYLLRAALSEFPGTDHRSVVVPARFALAIRWRIPRAQAPPAPRSARAPSLRPDTNKFDIARLFQESPVQIKANNELTWRQHKVAGVVSARSRGLCIRKSQRESVPANVPLYAKANLGF